MVFLLAEANWVKASLYPLAPPCNIPIHPITFLDFLFGYPFVTPLIL